MVEKASLAKIENDREILWDSDSEFLFEYQKAMLLALKELGTLNEVQYQYAEAALELQKQEYVRKKILFNNSSAI